MEFCIPGIMQSHDIDDVIAAIKNCPLLIHAGEDDEWSRGYDTLIDRVHEKGNYNVELRVFPGGHQFTPEMRENAYLFLAANLRF